MSHPASPLQPGEQHVLTDASGRTFVSSAPVAHSPVPHAMQGPQSMAPHCACAHPPAPAARTHGQSPAAMFAVGAGAALVIGTVLVALLLSVAVVAASVATCALALTVCAVVLRSMVNKPPARGRYRR
jgi:hypothetical protein